MNLVKKKKEKVGTKTLQNSTKLFEIKLQVIEFISRKNIEIVWKETFFDGLGVFSCLS